MTPDFALDLDHDGIRLMRRTATGWERLGAVALDDPELSDRLTELREAAEAEAPGGLVTELVIPPSQILYTTIPWAAGELRTERTIRPALEGLTPCDPDDLVFDWEQVAGGLRLAILEKVTLQEAEDFAEGYGFQPVTFSARPDPADFPREPDFGTTTIADRVLAALAAPPRPALPDRDPDAPETTGESETAVLARALAGPAHDRPEPQAPARPRKRPATEAEALTRFGARGREIAATLTPARLAAGAGLLAVAVLVWFAYFAVRTDGPSDPAAALSDVPPEIAGAAPDLIAPEPAPAAAPPERADAQPELALPAPPLADPGPSAAPPAAEPPPPTLFDGGDPLLRYAVTGIWPEGPPPLTPPGPDATGELYLTSIDPVTHSADALALILPREAVPDPRPAAPLAPQPPGTRFDLDADTGLVRATPEGAVTPDGIRVIAGRPDLTPPGRPASVAANAPTEVALAGPDLPDRRPRIRPSGLADRFERAQLGGRSRTELAGLRPAPRPASAQAQALAAADAAPTDNAIDASPAARARPDDFAARVATNRAVVAALAEIAEEAEPEPDPPARAAAPSIPTSASVARQATLENAIRLRDLNLIGVYGRDGDRRALVRLPSGRYVKVEVGDRLDGGRIAAISRNELRYVKGGRNITLTVPSG